MSAEEARAIEKTLYKIGKLVKTKNPFLVISLSEHEDKSGGPSDTPKIELVTNLEDIERIRAILKVATLMSSEDTGFETSIREVHNES